MAKEPDAASKEAAEKAATEAAEAEAAAKAKEEEEFDPERALETIKKQRESEKAAKERAKALEEELAKYKSAEEQKAEAEKALEVKVAERDAALEAKDAQIAELHIKHSFVAKAAAKGLADPELAYLAAKEQGLLGTYDPKQGTVSDHDWDKLGEKYPSFATSAEAEAGDAGARGKGKVTTPAAEFNKAIRGSLR